jgi:hypothetical protein
MSPGRIGWIEGLGIDRKIAGVIDDHARVSPFPAQRSSILAGSAADHQVTYFFDVLGSLASS